MGEAIATTDIDRTVPPFTELSVIRLTRPVASEDGQVPSGTSGTIVHIGRSGRAYEVEFTEPFDTGMTAARLPRAEHAVV